ncbi:hypothetical protein XENOCAPTIV_003038, partial [Xenoophorus captivus]
PKTQAPQRQYENKTNFSNSTYHAKDTSQTKFSHSDHRQQRNDRPPRFHKDTDFPKPGQDPASNSSTPQTSAAAQQWRSQEKWPRNTADRVQNDRREIRDEQNVPAAIMSPLTHLKESQQQTEISGAYHQRSRNGNGSNFSGPPPRRGVKENVPTSKPSNPAGGEVDGRGNYKRSERNEEAINNRRKGKAERPNSDHFDTQRGGGPLNFNPRGGGSGPSQEVGLSQSSRTIMGDPSHFQNGDLEHKRTGPIKPINSSCPQNREQQPKKNAHNNQGSKKRPGQGRGQGSRGTEKGFVTEHLWKPGDTCLALYWEDNKVWYSLTLLSIVIIVEKC